jgi:hypothetical protein
VITLSDLYYLVLRNGYRFNDLILKAGEIYTSADFEEVHEQRKVALVLGRIIYRGSLEDVKDKREKLFGIVEIPEEESKGESKKKTAK